MRRQTLLRRLLVGAGVVVVVVIIVLGPLLLSHLTKAQKQPALATVERQSFPVVASASGALQPAQLVEVNFSTPGQVSAIYVHVGQQVINGQLVAHLNDVEQQAILVQANAGVSAAQQQLAAAKASGSSAAIASALYQVASANALLVKAKHDEAATVLVAPESGSVLEVNGSVGDSVQPGSSGPPPPGATSTTRFIAIGNSANFVAWAPFSENDTVRLRLGQTGKVVVNPLPGPGLPCTIASIASSATYVGGVPKFYVACALSQPETDLRDGYTGTVNIDVAYADNVLAVPSQALFSNANGALQVDVWSGGQAYATTVTNGLTGNYLTQITSGLQAGEQVVLSPAGQSTLPSSPSPT
jgi:membrane fusion protein, macrolide-specific efflux system